MLKGLDGLGHIGGIAAPRSGPAARSQGADMTGFSATAPEFPAKIPQNPTFPRKSPIIRRIIVPLNFRRKFALRRPRIA